MGFISDLRSLHKVQKIKMGGKAKLSISQITNLIINLPDARDNLPPTQFRQIYALFMKLRTCTTTMEMDRDAYIQQACDIIKRFDAIAPYEKYSGGNEVEFSFFMEDLRSENASENPRNEFYNTDDESDPFENDDNNISNEKELYAAQLVEGSKGFVALEDALKFVDILHLYATFNKDVALTAFDGFVNTIVKKYSIGPTIYIVSFFVSVLNTNGIITQTELNSVNQNLSHDLIRGTFSIKHAISQLYNG